MNDPLRDNRIFPEEMQQKPPSSEKHDMNTNWLWVIVAVLVLGLCVYFGYQYYTGENSRIGTQQHESELEQEHREQLAIYNTLKESSPKMTEEERDRKIRVFFGNNE